MDAPVTHIDPVAFRADPYPALAAMRREAPVTFVPELGATLITRRADVHAQEKRVDVLSSRQPQGLMTRLMGENLMRKDGAAHEAERRVVFPAPSPRIVRGIWRALLREAAAASRAPIAEVALPLALKRLPGLRVAGPVPFAGWAFRGPTSLPAEWDA